MGVVKETGFQLPNKQVTVKYIKRRKGMAAGEHITNDHVISGGMLINSTKRFTVPMQRNGGLANILTKEEKDYLEGSDALRGANLSIYSDFWRDFYVTLRKEDNQFDMSRPMEYIQVRLLESLKDHIAPSWKQRNDKQSYQFVIVNEGEEFKETKRKYDSKKEAFKLYGKVEDDKDQLIGILKLITNKPISNGSKLDWIQGQVEEFIDNSPSKFVELMKDSSFTTKILINKGIEAGVIVKKSNKYSTVDGLSLCEADENPTFDNAVRYLDNNKNQEIRSLVEAKIKNAE